MNRSPASLATPILLGTLALVVLALPAFWPNYLSSPLPGIDAYTHGHAAVGTAWLALLVVQSLLMRAGRRTLHRSVGRLSFVLAPAFVVSSVLLAHHRFSRMSEPTFIQEAFTLYLPLSAALLFAGAYVGAMAWRRSADVHARFIACTALLLLDPVLGRCMAFYVPALPAMWHYQLVTFGAEVVALVILLSTLPRHASGFAAFRGFAVFYVFVLLLWFFVPPTAPWLTFATWFRGLALT